MSRAYRQWYNKLTLRNQLLVDFLLNWIFWFVARLIGNYFLLHEELSWGRYLFSATWMAFFTTIPFNWKKLKAIFKGNESINKTNA